jgi:cytochrome b561
MTTSNEREAWGGASIALHWLSFLVVLSAGVIGLLMGDMPRSVAKLQVYALHKSLGLTVLALTALRLLWRLAGGAPAALPGTPAWQARMASLTHLALYLLLLAVPLSGWWFNSLAGWPLQFWKLFNLPALVPTDLAAKSAAGEVHEVLFYVLAGVVALHAAAALAHHYYWRDPTLRRMWFARRAARLASSPSVPKDLQ